MDIQIKVANQATFEAAFRKAPEIAAREIRDALDESSGIIERDAFSLAPTGATNFLRDSIGREVRPLEAVVFSSADYAARVEYGTGSRGVGGLPIEHVQAKDLFDWARRKLGDQGLAYPIANIINRVGTYPHPFMKPARDKDEGQVVAIFQRALQRVIDGINTG